MTYALIKPRKFSDCFPYPDILQLMNRRGIAPAVIKVPFTNSLHFEIGLVSNEKIYRLGWIMDYPRERFIIVEAQGLNRSPDRTVSKQTWYSELERLTRPSQRRSPAKGSGVQDYSFFDLPVSKQDAYFSRMANLKELRAKRQ